MDTKLTFERLQRKALVYVRQSSMLQVIHNLESQRRQYGLTGRAQELGFRDIEVIDEDLGRSGSGCVNRPGFERLVTQVCSGEVGGVICVEASRLARNGRDWHHLIELCALVDTVIIDPEGVYDPSVTNDRLLLGLKGTMSEFELNLIRQRSREAIQQKARRGALHFRLPVGLCWNDDRIELDSDQHIQQVLRLVFLKMEELGSARQVFLWFHEEQLRIPVRGVDGKPIWKIPGYSTVMRILSNPFYAGAYVFGRTRLRTRMVDGRGRKTKEFRQWHHQQWPVLIRDHHPGYITWEQYERNQQTIEANAYMKPSAESKAGRGGRALLAGLLRCGRCGRMLRVNYTGAGARVLAYKCWGGRVENAACRGVSFGGQADQLVVQQVLEAVSGNAIEAALQAAAQERTRQGEHRRSLEIGVEQARYQARLAERRYEAVDPEQRWVAGELEARWNQALERVREAEAKCVEFDQRLAATAVPSQELLVTLAEDLQTVWNTAADMRLKQRIVHLVLREIVADYDPESREVTLVLHWAGGRHSEVRWTKNRMGWAGRSRDLSAVDVVGKMAQEYPDEQIALTLNRKALRAGCEPGWTVRRVRDIRTKHNIPEFQPAATGTLHVTLQAAAIHLQVSAATIRRLIKQGILPARQIVGCAPWQIPISALDSEPVKRALAHQHHGRRPRHFLDRRQEHMFSDT
jgi:DNA invertase Pin-like site-specific DNA recombinase